MLTSEFRFRARLLLSGVVILVLIAVFFDWLPFGGSGNDADPALDSGPSILPERIIPIPDGSIGFAFAADGRRLVTTANTGPTEIREIATGAVLFSIPTQALPLAARMLPPEADRSNHTGAVKSAVLSPDGRLLVTAAWDDPIAHLHDLAAGITIALAGHTKNIGAVAFAPDGRRIATASGDGTLRLFDLAGAPLATLTADGAPLVGVAFAPDGTRLLAFSAAAATLFDAQTLTPVATLPAGPNLRSARFSPDSARLLTLSGTIVPVAGADPGRAALWDARSGAAIAALDPPPPPVDPNNPLAAIVRDATFSPDGATIVAATSFGVVFFAAATGTARAASGVWLAANAGTAGRSPETVSYVGDRAVLVRYALASGVRVIAAANGAPIALLADGAGLLDPTVSPDGSLIATRSPSALTLWRLPAAPALPAP